jgi:putative mRNA 3-end processing factor
VLGSAQIRVEVDGEVWVVSGDFKRQPDPSCTPFEVVRCDTFITEATFALPIYRWPDTPRVIDEILDWREECAARDETAVLFVYALGKAQRLLAELARHPRGGQVGPVLLHGAVATGVSVYRQAGIALAETQTMADHAAQSATSPVATAATGEHGTAGRLVLAPPGAAGSPWLRRCTRPSLGFASGWMQLRGNRRRRNVDRGFIVSDHADWPDLLRTIDETGARRILAMHGDTAALIRYLREQGRDAAALGAELRRGEDD